MTDYKALVCIYMNGGNDSNSLIVPYTNAEYNQYAAARTNVLALSQSDLLSLVDQTGTAQYGFHPRLTGLHDLWQQGKVASLFNVGTLVQPITKAQFMADSSVGPVNLFSHFD